MRVRARRRPVALHGQAAAEVEALPLGWGTAQPLAGRPWDTASVRALQRTAGNAATAQLLHAAPGARMRTVQRDAQGSDPYHLRPKPEGRTPPVSAGGPFTSLPAELRRPIVEYFKGSRHVRVPSGSAGGGSTLRYDAAAPERNAAAWYHKLSAKQADSLVTIFQKMTSAGIWQFVKTLRNGPTGAPVDEGEPDALCIEQDGNSVSVNFSGDAAGLFKAIGSPFVLGWAVDGAMMGMMHKGQQSVRQAAVTSGLHVSIGPASNFDVHVDRHPPIPASSSERPARTWARLLQHGREELVPNMGRKLIATVLTLPTGGHGKATVMKAVPSLHLAPSMFYPGSPAWEAANWAQQKARDPYALEQEAREGLDTPFAVGVTFRFGSRR